MESMVPVNEMLKEEITKINYTMIPPGFQGDVRRIRMMQESLSRVIDMLGEESATAQRLNKVITSAEKLRNAPAHILYLLKDAAANGGKGEVIGLLKVGRKHLFLFDSRDQVREVEPLCVLDFYVQTDRQRHGYGRKLFDHMLQDMETSAEDLAIDGPSPKIEQFMAKNYGVEKLIRQSNNFAVSAAFFTNSGELSKGGRATPVLTPAVGRFAAHKPPSAIANVIHGGGSYYENKNGRVSGRATPDADMTLGEKLPEKRTPEPKSQPAPEPPLELSIPELEQKVKKLELEARPTERPSSLPVTGPTPASASARTPAPAAPSPAGSAISGRDPQLTERGFFDVKFYHNKLW